MPKFLTGPISRRLKRMIATAGALVALPGGAVGAVTLCSLLLNPSRGTLFGCVFVLMTLGAGGVAVWFAQRSLSNQPSHPLSLPPAWLIAGLFVLCLWIALPMLGGRFQPLAFLAFLLLIMAALPPLFALAWWMPPPGESLSIRRAMMAFAGGLSVSVWIALILEILFPAIVVILILNAGDALFRSTEILISDLAGSKLAQAITNPAFVFAMIQLAVVAPLVEELAKPLVTLPIIGRLDRRDAFMVGALAGAGFAAIENVLYAAAGLGSALWIGILVLRSLGAAIHPLGAGLTAMSWRDILNREPDAWRNGLARFGLAAGMHALWNGGSLLIITLGGAQFFGQLPPELNLWGLSAAGSLVALLLVLGMAALWIGRAFTHNTRLPFQSADESFDLAWVLADRTLALWALACLIAVAPVGIAALRLLFK